MAAASRPSRRRASRRGVRPPRSGGPVRRALSRRLSILDTFPAFEAYWQRARIQPIDVQIDLWEREYMVRWPELLAKQQQNYADEGIDWRRIARTRIFPYLPERLPRMRRIRRALLEGLPGSWARTQRILGLDFPVQFVIYVGVGCGAGWATRYEGRPACLFGLENAAERVTGRGKVFPGSVPHEVAHLAHDEWRRRDYQVGIEGPRGPYWQLYVEGFATACERQILSPAAFRLRTGRPDWLSWCRDHEVWLARKFLREVQDGRSTRPFFGSWYPIRGQVECGYWLGAKIVRDWRRNTSWEEIATLPETTVRERVRDGLQRMAERGGGRVPAGAEARGRDGSPT